jgi:hypothetical protein
MNSSKFLPSKRTRSVDPATQLADVGLSIAILVYAVRSGTSLTPCAPSAGYATRKLVGGDKVEKVPYEDAVSKVRKSTVLIAVH